MREPLVALFSDPRRADEAVQRLHTLGVRDVAVASPAPYRVLHHLPKPWFEPRLGWLVLAGACAGLLAAIGLQVHASTVYPFIVGGKPVLAWPAFAIVSFELTMLGAGLTNFVAFAVLGALSRRRVAAAARHAVTSTCLAVVVADAERTAEQLEAIRAALAGAEEVRS